MQPENMKPSPQVGQIVRLPNFKENLTVKSVDLHKSTVELIWMTDRRSILRRIPIMNLLPEDSRAGT